MYPRTLDTPGRKIPFFAWVSILRVLFLSTWRATRDQHIHFRHVHRVTHPWGPAGSNRCVDRSSRWRTGQRLSSTDVHLLLYARVFGGVCVCACVHMHVREMTCFPVHMTNMCLPQLQCSNQDLDTPTQETLLQPQSVLDETQKCGWINIKLKCRLLNCSWVNRKVFLKFRQNFADGLTKYFSHPFTLRTTKEVCVCVRLYICVCVKCFSHPFTLSTTEACSGSLNTCRGSSECNRGPSFRTLMCNIAFND